MSVSIVWGFCEYQLKAVFAHTFMYRLDMKLVFQFNDNGSADINSSPNGKRTPKHGKVLNIYLS